MPRRLIVRVLAVTTITVAAMQAIGHAAETADGKLFTQIPEVAPAAGQPVPAATDDPGAKKAITEGPLPVWIWGADTNKKYVVRKTFQGTA